MRIILKGKQDLHTRGNTGKRVEMGVGRRKNQR